MLSVTPNGTKSFYLYRRVRGRPSRILLGRHPLLSVEAARLRRREVRRDHRRSRPQRAEAGPPPRWHHPRRSVRPLPDEPRPCPGSRRTYETHKGRFDTCLAEWRGRRLDSIGRNEVIALHVKLGKKPGHTTANLAVQLLRALFNYAADKLNVNLANPAARVESTARRRASGSFGPTSCRSSSGPWRPSPPRTCATSSCSRSTPGPAAGTSCPCAGRMSTWRRGPEPSRPRSSRPASQPSLSSRPRPWRS